MITGKPLFSVQEIQDRVRELAEEISADYEGKEPVAVGVLKGAFMFFSDIVKHMRMPITVDFLTASSYVKSDTTGEVKIHCNLRDNIAGKDVILIDDILDTGITLNYIRESLLERNPRSLKTCVLLDKRERRTVDVPVDYRGFEIQDQYVVGYGLDYDGRFRNLPYIAVFKKSS